VTIEITFPVLLASFPDHGRYLAYYEEVVAAARQRGMQVDIEENPVFPGFSTVAADYSGLTLQSYATQQQEEAQLIIDDLRPTYLTILDETDTFAAHLGLPMTTPAAAAQVVNQELTGLRRGATNVGAGTGTWTSPTVDAALLTLTPIDYLSVHVYPIDRQSLDNLDTDVGQAKQAGKPVVLDEAWLYKQAVPGIGGPGATAVVSRLDAFSFFAPLDQSYLAALTAYARTHGIVFVSPFWSGEFFAYLTWTPQLDALPSAALRARAASAQGAATSAALFTSTGRAYGLQGSP
jgi:hypothetical protein